MIKLRNLLKEAAADGHIKIDPGPKTKARYWSCRKW